MEGYKQQETDVSLHVDHQVPMYARINKGSGHGISELQIRFCGCRRVQIEQTGH